MPFSRALSALLLAAFGAWACAFEGDAPKPERLILFVDADNIRIPAGIAKLRSELASLRVTPRHRVTIRHVPVDVWSAADIEEKLRPALRQSPSVIVAGNAGIGLVAKRIAPNVPVVFVSHQDPIRVGLVNSLAHPGGHLTGLTFFAPIDLKRLEVLRELAPGARRLGIVVDRWWMEGGGAEIVREARLRQGFEGEAFLAETLGDLREQLSGPRARGMDAWYVPYTGLPFEEPTAVLNSVAALGKPVVFPARVFVERGGLASYQHTLGVDEVLRVVATMVGFILDGIPAGEIPIERPKQFELWVNLDAARSAGIALPQGLLKRADRVIAK